MKKVRKWKAIWNCLKAKQFQWALWHLQNKNIFEETMKKYSSK